MYQKHFFEFDSWIFIFHVRDELSNLPYSKTAWDNADTKISEQDNVQFLHEYRDFLFVRIKAYKSCIRKVFGPGGIAGVRQAC